VLGLIEEIGVEVLREEGKGNEENQIKGNFSDN
jgi:hypothetical protein